MGDKVQFTLGVQEDGAPTVHIQARLNSADDALTFGALYNAVIDRFWPDAGAPQDEAQDEAQNEADPLPDESPAEAATAGLTAVLPPPTVTRGSKMPPIRVTPGTTAAAVLDCLQRGVVDPVAIADALDLKTQTAVMLKGRIINAGHWSPR